MDKEIIRVKANTLIDQMIHIKDRHRDILNSTEIDAINDTCNLISHNIKYLEEIEIILEKELLYIFFIEYIKYY